MSDQHAAESAHIHDDEFEALVEAVALDTGEPFFTLDQTLAAVERIVAARLAPAWTEGYDRAMQDAHTAHSRWGYVERLGESDDWNPYLVIPSEQGDRP